MKDLSKVEQVAAIKNWLGAGSINVFGRQYAGKDTLCEKLANLLGGHVIGGGDIIRAMPRDHYVRQTIDQGHLAPTEEFVALVTPYFGKAEFAGKPLLLSTVGRWKGEEDAIIQAANDGGHPIKAVVLLDITNVESFKRWEIKHEVGDRIFRHDDTEERLRTRLRDFEEKTIPVLDVYESMGLLIEIDGTLSREDVFDEVLAALAQKATS